MNKQTFTWRRTTVTVREKLGRDVLSETILRRRILEQLYPGREIINTPDVDWNQVATFTDILLQTAQIEGDAVPALPSPSAPVELIVSAYTALMESPASLMDAWKNALKQVEESENDFLDLTSEKSSEVSSNSELSAELQAAS